MKRLNKKAVVLAAVALLLGGGAYLNYMQAQRAAESQMSDLTLANLEAMAAFPTRPDGELPPTTGGDGDMGGGDIGIGGGGGGYNICYYESRVKKGYTYYACTKCSTKIYDEQGKGSYSKCFY